MSSVLRPGVVWFDEELDPTLVERGEQFLARSLDIVLSVGTNAAFDYIVDWIRRGRTLVVINAETEASQYGDWAIRRPAGAVLPELLGLASA